MDKMVVVITADAEVIPAVAQEGTNDTEKGGDSE